MVARLAFSVATEADTDILIIDEVLAVGDARFRQKSKESILAYKDRGIAVLFVSHDLAQVQEVCDKALWLDHGAIQRYGDTHEIISEYVGRQAAVKRTG